MPPHAGKWGNGGGDALAKQLKQLAQLASTLGSSASGGLGEKAMGWACLCSDCDFAKKGRLNWQDRTTCWSCLRTKSDAMNPPSHARLRPSPAPSAARGDTAANKETSNKENKKREARARKRQGRLQARAAAGLSSAPPAKEGEHQSSGLPSPVLPPPGVAANSGSTKLALPIEVVRAIPLLLPHAAKLIVDNLALDSVPAGSQEQKSPEAVVSKLLGDRGPSAKVAKKADLEGQITRLKTILVTMGTDDSVSEATKLVQAQLDAASASLLKLSKATPSQEHERMAVAEARSTYELSVQARRDRELRGAAKAEERRLLRQKLLQDLKDQVRGLEDGLLVAEADNNMKHVDRAAAASDFDSQVLALFDRKMLELRTTAPGQAHTAQDSPVVVAAATPLGELQAAREQISLLQERLRTAADKVQAAFDRSHDIDPALLPKVPLPPKDQLVSYGALFRTIQSWTMSGATCPFDWGSLAAAMGNGGPLPAAIGKNLLGPLWNSWYLTDPAGDEVVPRQVALLMFHGLNGIKIEYENVEQEAVVSRMAVDAYGAVRASGKRLRTSPIGLESETAPAGPSAASSSAVAVVVREGSEAGEAARKMARGAMLAAESSLGSAAGSRPEG